MSASAVQVSSSVATAVSAEPTPANDANASVKDVGLESLQNLPSVGLNTQLEQLQMIDQEPPASLRTQRAREMACYLCLYISGYK